jgi:protein SCO1/2
VVGLVAVAAFALFSYLKSTPPDLQRFGAVPPFTLTTQDGTSLSDAELLGKVWMTDFMFTRCRTLCPVLSKRMKALQEGLRDRTGWALISFTVDPDHDTAEILNAYAQEQGADTEHWTFLTGDKQTIYDLSISGFHLGVDDEGGNDVEPILHSQRIILIDDENEIRGYYNAQDDADMQRLLSDAKRVLDEASP